MSIDNVSQLLRSLQHVDAYPHAVDGEIQMIETHISWVFLAGNYAYKIKKPIRTSFLDYTTLALRKQYCEEELRLNKRCAADLYLGMVAIVDNNGHLFIDRCGEPVEYAVRSHWRLRIDSGFAVVLGLSSDSSREGRGYSLLSNRV